jgi:hypothetical protein
MGHGKGIRAWESVKIQKIPFPNIGDISPNLVKRSGLLKKPTDNEVISRKEIRILADLATNLWRAKQRLVGSIEKGASASDLKKILRPLDSALENLENLGVRIEDLTGQPYVQGMALNVVSSQPNSAVVADRIFETLKPTIYFREQFIQAGDVIIEGPPSSPESSLQD